MTLGIGSPTAAVSWAEQLLQDLANGGVTLPTSSEGEEQDLQFIYDWQMSEGPGGDNNPLNVGPEAGLSTSGSQFGGGAADYPSTTAAAQAAADYLLNPGNQQAYGYGGILSGLEAGSYQQASAALIASSWASGHYGGGSAWSQAAIPAAALTDSGVLVGTTPSDATYTPASSTSSGGSPSSSSASGSPADVGQSLGASAVGGISTMLDGLVKWFDTPKLIAGVVAVVVLYMGWGHSLEGAGASA